ncbi:MAG TPA: hypothetical protein VGH72_33505 [Pseudonocardia sp.]|jgi:hypothetical protein
MADLHDLLAQAHAAVQRARYVSRGLDQSSRVSDVLQVSNGILTELGIIERSVTQALERLSGAEQLAAGDRTGKVRSDARATSRAAATAITMRTGTQRSLVLLELTEGNGKTDFELQQTLKMSPSTERPRRGELVDYGLVRPSARTRWHGDTEWTVWELTPLGRSISWRQEHGEDLIKVDHPSSHTQASEQVSTVDTVEWGDGTLF